MATHIQPSTPWKGAYITFLLHWAAVDLSFTHAVIWCVLIRVLYLQHLNLPGINTTYPAILFRSLLLGIIAISSHTLLLMWKS